MSRGTPWFDEVGNSKSILCIGLLDQPSQSTPNWVAYTIGIHFLKVLEGQVRVHELSWFLLSLREGLFQALLLGL